jgi:glycine cleavage system transcriptional repressor
LPGMQVAVTAVGADRPGIAAAVTKILFEHGGNIEDSRMAILGGHFSMMLIVATDADPASIQRALEQATSDLGLIVAVRPVAEATAEHSAGAPYVVSVYGADHPGIVYRVTATLSDHGVNVTDLATRVLEGNVYVMILEVTLPAGLEAATLESALKALAAEVNVDVSLRPVEADSL